MERRDRAGLATFYAPDLAPGAVHLSLAEAVARHATVRRLSEGDTVRLTNGAGILALAVVRTLRKHELVVELREIGHVAPQPPLEVFPPVADRDRMLWLAEKCAEMAISVWQPVLFTRSRSVAPRGEGKGFATKLRARMIAALEQSGGAWLPNIRQELPIDEALRTVTAPGRLVLDAAGDRIDPAQAFGGAAVTFGPEGGLEADELALLEGAGWRRASLGPTTLRFETAGIAAVAILRAGIPPANSEG